MVILNTEKIVKIRYYEKRQNSNYYYSEKNHMVRNGYFGYFMEVNQDMIKNERCYLLDGLVWYLPCVEFIFDNKTSELKHFDTNDLAIQFIEKLKQEANLKTLTIE